MNKIISIQTMDYRSLAECLKAGIISLEKLDEPDTYLLTIWRGGQEKEIPIGPEQRSQLEVALNNGRTIEEVKALANGESYYYIQLHDFNMNQDGYRWGENYERATNFGAF